MAARQILTDHREPTGHPERPERPRRGRTYNLTSVLQRIEEERLSSEGIQTTVYCFNPSIAPLQDGLYLLSYRVFTRMHEKDNIRVSYEQRANHPWLTAAFFDPTDGKDDTHFALVRWTDEGPQVISAFEPYINMIDTRLLSLADNKVLLVAETLAHRRTVVSRGRSAGRQQLFTLMHAAVIEYKRERLHMTNTFMLCPALSEELERNWSPWTYGGSLYTTYGLSMPAFRSFRIARVADLPAGAPPSKGLMARSASAAMCDTESDQLGSDYYKRLESLYQIHVSTSTPAIPWRGDWEYLGVGHIKFKVTIASDLPDTPLAQFLDGIEDPLQFHARDYCYMMFFYTFNPRTRDLSRVGTVFSPERGPRGYLLHFASGLCALGRREVIVSYGIADSGCGFKVFTAKQVEELLHDPQEVPPHELPFVRL